MHDVIGFMSTVVDTVPDDCRHGWTAQTGGHYVDCVYCMDEQDALDAMHQRVAEAVARRLESGLYCRNLYARGKE